MERRTRDGTRKPNKKRWSVSERRGGGEGGGKRRRPRGGGSEAVESKVAKQGTRRSVCWDQVLAIDSGQTEGLLVGKPEGEAGRWGGSPAEHIISGTS